MYRSIRIFVKRKEEYEYRCTTDKYKTPAEALAAYVEMFPKDNGKARAYYKDDALGYKIPR